MLKHLFVAATLSVAGLNAAIAEMVGQHFETPGSWFIRVWEDAEVPGRQRMCTAWPTGAAQPLRFAIQVRQPRQDDRERVLSVRLVLSNEAWAVPNGNRGNVTITVGSTPYDVLFHRSGPTQVESWVGVDEPSMQWLHYMIGNGPLNIRVPSGETQQFASGSPEVLDVFRQCVASLSPPPLPRDPFAAPAAASPERNPFAPAR